MADRDDISACLGPDWTETRLTEVSRSEADPTGLQRIAFTSSFGDRVPALYSPSRNGAAVLYCHAHGDRYDIGTRELTEGRPALLSPWLPDLARRGWGVLCVEMPCFGSRQGLKENTTANARLWHGRTLFGQMLGEQRAGVEWLARQGETDPRRVAVIGISMGGTLAWWLAALWPRFAAAVSMCCFADLGRLIDSGAHDGHGNYMTVPGLLKLATTGQISGLAAPTPLLHCVGLTDWSTPEDAFRKAQSELQAAYAQAGALANLRFHEAAEPGHEETPAMRDSVLRFLGTYLSP